MTIAERRPLKGTRVAYCGDIKNNVVSPREPAVRAAPRRQFCDRVLPRFCAGFLLRVDASSSFAAAFSLTLVGSPRHALKLSAFCCSHANSAAPMPRAPLSVGAS